jgi:hypothetical protein
MARLYGVVTRTLRSRRLQIFVTTNYVPSIMITIPLGAHRELLAEVVLRIHICLHHNMW